MVSTAEDEHARVVLAELERIAADARLLNLSEFPEGASLVMRYGTGTRCAIRSTLERQQRA